MRFFGLATAVAVLAASSGLLASAMDVVDPTALGNQNKVTTKTTVTTTSSVNSFVSTSAVSLAYQSESRSNWARRVGKTLLSAVSSRTSYYRPNYNPFDGDDAKALAKTVYDDYLRWLQSATNAYFWSNFTAVQTAPLFSPAKLFVTDTRTRAPITRIPFTITGNKFYTRRFAADISLFGVQVEVEYKNVPLVGAALKITWSLVYPRPVYPSITPSPSSSPSKTPSSSPSPSSSRTPSPSATASISRSPSPSATASISRSASPSATASISRSASPSATASISRSARPSISATASISVSPSASASVTPSVSPSLTPTPSVSESASPSVTPAPSESASPSPSTSPIPSPAASSVPVRVNTPTGETVNVNINNGTTVIDVRTQVSDSTGVPLDRQILTVGGVDLTTQPNNSTMGELNITQTSVITLGVKLVTADEAASLNRVKFDMAWSNAGGRVDLDGAALYYSFTNQWLGVVGTEISSSQYISFASHTGDDRGRTDGGRSAESMTINLQALATNTQIKSFYFVISAFSSSTINTIYDPSAIIRDGETNAILNQFTFERTTVLRLVILVKLTRPAPGAGWTIVAMGKESDGRYGGYGPTAATISAYEGF